MYGSGYSGNSVLIAVTSPNINTVPDWLLIPDLVLGRIYVE